ncbi:hypothetical protein BamMEX5DRAFT_6215 [Burkholderia ambifaria MEX-5]|uniref:Uncharacterized protein n=1 Tax=Burkholderia ambifaria MEX-5 TaxID=396597 RepID=B1TEJ9_9BURK|nr:hypothetical protein BamMEX5DRAFT_6215 [Burkholderia ambifaria MEX-5]
MCGMRRAAAALCVMSPSASSAPFRRALSAAIRSASRSSFFGGQLARGAHPDDLMRRERARAQAALVAAAVNLRRDAIGDVAAHEQRADALGAIHLVRGHRQQVDAERTHVDRRLAERLRGVDVQQRARRMHDARDRADVRQRAELVVDEHQRHEARIGANRRGDGVDGDFAVGGRAQVSGRHPALRQVRHRVEDGLVFDAARDQVALVGGGLRVALQREVVRFGGARRPDDLVGVRADQCGNLRACVLDFFLRQPAGGVRARRGIAEDAVGTEAGRHRFDHAGIRGGGGCVVEVVQRGGIAHVLLLLFSAEWEK